MRLSTQLLFLIMLIVSAAATAAQTDTRTKIFDENFHTVQLKVNGSDMVPPVITLGSNQHLNIGFDEFSDQRSYLRYELIHCNRNWQPSGLVESEFLDGFNQADINDFSFSRATLTHYVHYDITIPNEQTQITASGNYLLRVYPEDDPENTLLQVRFYVNEGTMKLAANVNSITDIDTNDRHQQVDVVVDIDRVPVRDMYSDLKVVVSQNSRPDTERTPSAPLKVYGQEAYFQHNRDLIFPAGNEYRRMEVISTQFTPMGVESIGRLGTFYTFYLYPDYPRAGANYSYDQTQNGRFRIREYSTDLPDTEADYVGVYFRLEMPEIEGGDIFLEGDITNRLYGPESLMVYNRAEGAYEIVKFLKQGAYNYQYVFVPHGSENGLTAPIEGDFAQTGNEYFIRLYHRSPADRYDRLTAVMTLMP